MSKSFKLYTNIVGVAALLGLFGYGNHLASAPPTPCGRPHPGETGPFSHTPSDFTLESLNGERVSLSDFRGQVVILDFWATWIVNVIPTLDRIQDKYASRGLKVIVINDREGRSTVQDVAKKENYRALVLLDKDGSVSGQYGINGLPSLIVIDKQGRTRKIYRGCDPDIGARLEKDIEALL